MSHSNVSRNYRDFGEIKMIRENDYATFNSINKCTLCGLVTSVSSPQTYTSTHSPTASILLTASVVLAVVGRTLVYNQKDFV